MFPQFKPWAMNYETLYQVYMFFVHIGFLWLPVAGPTQEVKAYLAPVEERFVVIVYADDLKPAVTSLCEIKFVNEASILSKQGSGCKLQCNITEGKCKLIHLSSWKSSLTWIDITVDYIMLSDQLKIVGVEWRAHFTQTRRPTLIL